MRKTFSFICALMAILLCSPQADAARKRTRSGDEKPIITIKTDAYNVIGESNNFGISLGATETDWYDIDTGFGMQELEVEPWQVVDGGIQGTYKSIQVSSEGLIRIYGDPSKIDMIELQGGYVTEIDMQQCTNLEVLDLSHNTLKKLDLTPFTKLYAIYLSDNPFTAETPLKIGAPKNQLAILEIDIVEHLDQEFNLSDYPAMQAFDAYHNLDLWNIDPTGCPELLTMSLELTNVSKLDVTKNPKLLSLNISETRITDIDLSNNPRLTTLMAEHASGSINTGYFLNNVDLSKLPNLNILYMGGNRLKSIDLSNNKELFTLNLRKNNLTSLDLSNNTNLYSVTITANDMNFATLPEPQPTWGEYYYLQNDIRVPKSMDVNDVLDLSAQVLRPGSETYAAVWQKVVDGNDSIIDPTLYTFSEGKVKFAQALTDSVYVRYSNTMLADYDVYTTPFMVKIPSEMGLPVQALSFACSNAGQSVAVFIGIDGASQEKPATFLVDFGDGVKKEFTAYSSTLPATANLTGTAAGDGTITVYTQEGEAVTAFAMSDIPLASIDLRNSHSLRTLKVNNSGLRNIDLRYNRCLESIDLDGNMLAELDLTGLYPNWDKHVLTSLSAAGNQLQSVTVTSPQQMTYINLKGNRLAEFSLKDYDNMKHINLSDNEFSGEISLAYLIDADTIILSGNRLQRIVHDTFSDLKLLDITDNCFGIETLPYQPGAAEYIYAPQKPIEILKNAPAINLSDQNRVIADGQGTTFTWKKEDGTLLVEGVDMTCEAGATRFLKTDLGKVYCEMTNPAFPQLSGENVLRTSYVNIVGAPTKVLASFTTLEDTVTGELTIASPVNTSVFIDWRGDGSEYTPYYAYSTSNYDVYEGIRTFKGANVKVYTYDDPADLKVFSLSGIKMGSFDGSGLTGLSMLGIYEAGLSDEALILPDIALESLSLPGNSLTSMPANEKYADLINLNLSNNELTAFNAADYKKLRTLYLSNNKVSDIHFDNPNIWELTLDGNGLESIDLTGLKNLEQLWLVNNKLSEINVLPFRSTLSLLGLSNNRFTFATLPVQSNYPKLTGYFYGNQENVEAIVSEDGMTYDLSSQATVNGNYQTEYTWFLGEPVYDSESGTLSGETLYVDDEYTLENGVTTFTTRFSEDVVCVMTNNLFPSAYLRTPAYRVGTSGVETVGAADSGLVDVYTLSGTIVKRQAERSVALEGLPEGIYIMEGKKVFVK